MADFSLAPVCCVSERVGVLEVDASGERSATFRLLGRLAQGAPSGTASTPQLLLAAGGGSSHLSAGGPCAKPDE